MSKGFNNFMSKKAFHPASYKNQKRIQEAEAKAEAKKKHDEETLAQYLKEQELFNQHSLLSKESKEKLSLSFMYDCPPGMKKTEDKQSDKIEWTGSHKDKKPIIKSDVSKLDPRHGQSSKHQDSDDSDDDSRVILEWKREPRVKKEELPSAKRQRKS